MTSSGTEEVRVVLREMDAALTYGDAYAFSTYSETLVPRQGGQSQLVVGRLVFFLHHLARDGWRIALLMNSHSRPIEHLT